MKKATDFIWLASYPRSGNTFLRTILWHCFGLKSGSIYPNDLGGNKILEQYVGHIEHGQETQQYVQSIETPLVKTHEQARDEIPAIYVIRDGRATCVSLWEFYNRSLSLESVIDGQHQFGTWANHVESWCPQARENTLLVKYENLKDDLPEALKDISAFLKKDIITTNVPTRDKVANIDGRWVRKKTNWKSELYGSNLKRFLKINKGTLRKFDYL